MLRVFLIGLTLIAAPLWAQDTRLETVMGHVRASDRDAVNHVLRDAQSGFLAGKVSADDMRDLFIGLSRSHPQTVRFVQDWADSEPDNGFARIARAWSLWNAADMVWRSRNPYANDAYGRMKQAAVEHASAAIALEPELIPASDAVLRMYGYDSSIGDPVAEIERVMGSHPNWGSLLRVFYLVGRHGKDAFGPFCRDYAERVTPDATAQCLMYGTVHFNRNKNEDFVTWADWDPNNGEMIKARISALLYGHAVMDLSEEQMDWLEDAMLNFDADLYELIWLHSQAVKFANRIGYSRKRPLFLETFEKVHLDRAARFLAEDPNNLDLMDMVEGVAFAQPMVAEYLGNGAISLTPFKAETEEEEAARRAGAKAEHLEFARQRVLAYPLSSGFWESVAHAYINDDIANYFEVDGAFQNGVIYAQDPIAAFDTLLLNKVQQLEVLTHAENPEASGEWVKIAKGVDRTADILCPSLRALRLRQALCTYDPDGFRGCQEGLAYQMESYDIIYSEAAAAPECGATLNAEIDSLWYEPVPFLQAVPSEQVTD